MKRKRVRLNVKFSGDKICCAKSPGVCGKCKELNKCELLDMYYYPYDDIKECMKHDSYKRERGALKQRK
ncbi:hypothetical protein JW813_09225 [Clostridium botulinum]|uniref:hypothetical protein n=1 Tax=Clostridium botulinum TaxID=1491 RepID=UPI0007737C51|nr:hypothetical protein [Clostridium botulinum]MBY7025198.1 hypothetical protein [Clostridium botulinum]NFE73363.1 hypothetical protein [Clostridium botulinum]NFE83351.1 hypothetical protein [Clostridium botulinum]NFG36791.1 hypothetical protein [Clostridium botulinum]NFN27411.1 hypothetical protein [Clostridium botulinum]